MQSMQHNNTYEARIFDTYYQRKLKIRRRGQLHHYGLIELQQVQRIQYPYRFLKHQKVVFALLCLWLCRIERSLNRKNQKVVFDL